jgi:hypothetical protein
MDRSYISYVVLVAVHLQKPASFTFIDSSPHVQFRNGFLLNIRNMYMSYFSLCSFHLI